MGRITWDDELSVACPMRECGQPAGTMCVYTTAPAGCGHKMGDEALVPHRERRRVGKIIRERRARDQRLRALAETSLRTEMSQLTAAARTTGIPSRRMTVLGRNPDEQVVMRAWLAEHGHILWEQA